MNRRNAGVSTYRVVSFHVSLFNLSVELKTSPSQNRTLRSFKGQSSSRSEEEPTGLSGVQWHLKDKVEGGEESTEGRGVAGEECGSEPDKGPPRPVPADSTGRRSEATWSLQKGMGPRSQGQGRRPRRGRAPASAQHLPGENQRRLTPARRPPAAVGAPLS